MARRRGKALLGGESEGVWGSAMGKPQEGSEKEPGSCRGLRQVCETSRRPVWLGQRRRGEQEELRSRGWGQGRAQVQETWGLCASW